MIATIGLMSGTSLDGVDAAWIKTDGVSIAGFGPALTLAYPPALRARLRRLLDQAEQLHPASPEVLDVAEALTRHHAEAVTALGCEALGSGPLGSGPLGRGAELIGFHGQTILHRPVCVGSVCDGSAPGRTWQIGDARLLAQLTQTRVAYDFRSADVAAGGQGAPLAPVFHAALAADLEGPIAILNIGGIANVTWISGDRLVAFDTGPGNGLLDDWVQRAGFDCDRNGQISAEGQVSRDVLAHLLADAYFARPVPKSLDRLDFAAAIAGSGLSNLSLADGAATLAAFTVAAVSLAPLPGAPRRWLVCGGGRHNPTIMRGLASRLGVPVDPVEALGWNGDALEAQCFGFLAARVVNGLPLSFPHTTGVASPTTGGAFCDPT
jgi:anhydro-N-acetylmuramic acid kinase